MGQYYKAYVKRGDDVRVYDAHESAWLSFRNREIGAGRPDPDPYSDDYWRYTSGLKLMEHSWIGNLFVSGVLEAVEDAPARIAWVGDYADSDKRFYGALWTPEVYEACWVEDKSMFSAFPEVPGPVKDGFLCNVSRHIAIDLAAYMDANGWREVHDGHESTWCIHPLPLLTAVGNGLGGGDYRGKIGQDLVGLWAMDEICWVRSADGLPEGCEAVDPAEYKFSERDDG